MEVRKRRGSEGIGREERGEGREQLPWEKGRGGMEEDRKGGKMRVRRETEGLRGERKRIDNL